MTLPLPFETADNARSVAVPTFLKWAGGKSSLLPTYERYFPKTVSGCYYEPFLGSGAVFFYLCPDRGVLSDLNEELVITFRVVQNYPNELMNALQIHEREYTGGDYYYFMRSQDTTSMSEIERAARFVFLNKTSYNGLYRENGQGKFNVPWGQYEKLPRLFDRVQMLKASNLLKNIRIEWSSYEEVLRYAGRGDFVYLDPPYAPVSSTSSFTSYTSYGFSSGDQEDLSIMFRELNERGVALMLSNSDTEFIRGLYDGFHIAEVETRRYINSNGEGRHTIRELVIRNYL